jgi:outer membrane protein OmpA-like peptidoglycan-associated protein
MKRLPFLLPAFVAALSVCACGTSRKAGQLQEQQIAASLALPQHQGTSFREIDMPRLEQDTLVVHDFEGHEVMVMNAVRDESSGEMVASETLQAARVTARFRNVAERHGRVDLEFQVIVPAALQDSRWQVRFHPRMEILEDTVDLDDILITGKDYRKAQLRGYQQYERFLRSIITDSTRFIDRHQLEVFIKRNIPALYAYRQDTSLVSDQQFASVYGVTEQQAIDYYTYGLLVRRNERKIRDKDKMFRKYVKAPLQKDHLRLDTLMVNDAGEFVYNYVQTIATRPRLRKVDIRLSGEVCEQDKVVYGVPESDPLTFYISSLSAFVDGRERYLDQIVSRRVDLQSEAKLLFEVGDDTVREELGDNLREIIRIRSTLASLLEDAEFDLDSIVVTAHASPEGSWRANGELSQRRGRSVGRYFAAYMKQYADSADRAVGYRMNLDGTLADPEFRSRPEIRFSSYAVPENWELLDRLVAEDRLLSEPQKMAYQERRKIDDPDRRELAMRADDYYPYLSKELYPRLRSVVFDFRLHRRNMLQDTIHTTVLDTAYMAGVQAIRDRDYKKALTLLRPYEDFNTAIAYCCLDYNASALSVLEKLDRSAEVNYMLALVYARQGDERSAVECYLLACAQNGSFVHRGNLDPEISALIRKYDLNRES